MEKSNVTMIIFLSILIILSGFFSVTETAFSSLNKILLLNDAILTHLVSETILLILNTWNI